MMPSPGFSRYEPPAPVNEYTDGAARRGFAGPATPGGGYGVRPTSRLAAPDPTTELAADSRSAVWGRSAGAVATAAAATPGRSPDVALSLLEKQLNDGERFLSDLQRRRTGALAGAF